MSDSEELQESEISLLHTSLLLECENLESVTETHSAPSTPALERRGAFDFSRPRSLQSSPTSIRSSVKTTSVKDLIQLFDYSKTMADKARNEAAEYFKQIGHAKKWLTRNLNNLESALLLGGNNKIDPSSYKFYSDKILTQFEKVVKNQIALEDIYAKNKASPQFEPIGKELDKYLKDTQDELNVFPARVDYPAAAGVLPASEQVSKAELLAAVSHQGQEQIKVNVECPKFKGDESDRLEFKNWYEKIDALIKSRSKWSDEFKLLYLKNHVIGNATAFIAHIDPGPEAYETCIAALKEQYLDESYIIDEYFKKLLSDKPEFDPTYFKTRTFIANTSNHLHNLKSHYGVDLLHEDHNAHKFLSHIIFPSLA